MSCAGIAGTVGTYSDRHRRTPPTISTLRCGFQRAQLYRRSTGGQAFSGSETYSRAGRQGSML